MINNNAFPFWLTELSQGVFQLFANEVLYPPLLLEEHC